MKGKIPKFSAPAIRSSGPFVDPGADASASNVSRREFLNVGLAAAALGLLMGCAKFRRSQSDLDVAISDLRKTLDGFEGDGARQAHLASLGRRIENRCREVTEEFFDVRQRLDVLSRQQETSSAELNALVEDFATRRVKYRDELLGVQDELRKALTKEEWDQTVQVLNSGVDAFSQARIKRS